jgi:1-acyl-sn-glycerol-3-phosphate acyltransferase
MESAATAMGRRPGPDPERLLAVVRRIAEEQHPFRKGQLEQIGLDVSLETDLAIDSLGRVELLERLGQTFEVELDESLVAAAATPADLLAAVAAAPPGGTRAAQAPVDVLDRTLTNVPAGAETMLEVLEWHVAEHPDRVHVRFLESDSVTRELTYAELHQGAAETAAGMWAKGFAPGQAAAIMLPTSLDFFFAFLGIEMAGGVPVPIYPPARLNQIEDHLRRHAGILDSAGCTILISVPEARAAARLLHAHAASVRGVATVEELRRDPGSAPWPVVGAGDLAFLQYTSGSTGNPKGVMLTHANLLANIRAMGLPFGLDPEGDVVVSWLPLYHDMGLIGAWMCSLYYSMPLVLMSPIRFLNRPERWLRAISDHGGTISASPNFGYEIARARIREETLAGVDLSTWRVAANGAEPVLPATLAGFQERFERYGLSSTSLRPVYGLAENSVGLSFPAEERAPRIDRIARDEFSRTGRAVLAESSEPAPLEFPACGQPIPGHEIRVVDAQGRETPNRQEGAIEFRGPSATSGYFQDPEATKALMHDGWLRTGDRGYLAGGEIYVTGRDKDTIIRSGRNLYAAEMEEAVGRVDGIRTGCVAAFGVHRAGSGTEAVVVMAETRETDPGKLATLRDAVTQAVTATIGERLDEVALVPPYTVLKTSSGKIRRAATRALFERGAHAGGRRSVWLQFALLSASALWQQLHGAARRASEVGYGAWWWLCAGVLALAVWPLISLVPNAPFAAAWLRGAARAFLAAVCGKAHVDGTAHLPQGPLVLVSNHTSFLDGLALMALLPRRARFVAKNTLSRSFWSGPFLRHLGTLFVERFDPQRGAGDATAIGVAVASGDAVVFFPEGTFGRMPGLLPFRMGAFGVAAQMGAPVVPVAIRGARTMLRAGSWLPRRATVSLAIGNPIAPAGGGWDSALALRDAARAAMLKQGGEVDLRFETREVEKLRARETGAA